MRHPWFAEAPQSNGEEAAAGAAAGPDPLALRIGQRIRRRREELGITQQELAGRELTRGFISQLEKGIVMPSLKSLEIIAARLHKPLAYFLQEEPSSPPAAQASRHLELACQHMVLGDEPRAEELLQRAHQLAGEATDSPAFQGRLALARAARARRAGQVAAAAEELARAAQQLWLAGDEEAALQAQVWWAESLLALGEAPAAARGLEEALLRTAGLPPLRPQLRLQARALLGICLQRAGRPQEAAALLEQVLQESERWGIWPYPDQVLLALGLALEREGPRAAASAASRLHQASCVAEALAHDRVRARALQELARLVAREDPERACQALEAAYRCAQQAQDSRWAASLLGQLAELLAERGLPGQALSVLEQALEQAQGAERVRLLVRQGQLLAQLGEDGRAKAVLEQALQWGEREGDPRDVAAACSQLGQLLRRQGDHQAAGEYLARAVALYESTSPR
ncbi:MAG TPA: tetratricopeptide repeat protein [Limnochordales bacterium]